MAHESNSQSDRNKISSITRQLANLGKPVDGSDRGLGIITLAGSNKGAVMKASLDDEVTDNKHIHIKGLKKGEEKLSAYTNSNYQAVNNSIMMDGKLEAEDPGVHVEMVDFIKESDDEIDYETKGNEDEKQIKKDNKKEEKEEKHSEGKSESE